MELKYIVLLVFVVVTPSFNRTFMELKSCRMQQEPCSRLF